MPTTVRYAVACPHMSSASGYASIDAVPYLDAAGREGYRHFLNQHPNRAFAVSAEGGDDPMALALENCRQQGTGACRLYAVDNHVVWHANEATATAEAVAPADGATHALASR